MLPTDSPEPRRLVESEEDSNTGRLLRSLPVELDPPLGKETASWARLTQARRGALGFHWARRAAMATAVLAILVGGMWLLNSHPVEDPEVSDALAAVVMTRGEVQTSAQSAQSRRAAVGDEVDSSSVLTTQASAELGLRFSTAGALLSSQSEMKVRGLRSGRLQLELRHGEVLVSSSKRAPGAELTVLAAGYVVTVVGTVFRVQAQPFGVQVLEGVVAVKGPQGERRVRSGETFSPQGAMSEGDPQKATALAWLRVERPGERPTHVRANDSREEGGDLRGLVGEDLEALVPAQASIPAPTTVHELAEARVDSPEPLSAGAGQPRVVRNDDAPAHTRSAQPPGASPHRDALALYRMGEEALRRRDAREAARLFEEYRQRFPTAALIQEAWFSLIEAHLMNHSYTEALAESESFLRRFPQSERRDRVRLLAANVERELGDCASAISRYDSLRQERGSEADDAAFFAAICAAREGHHPEATQRFDEYLRAFPEGRHRQEALNARKP